MTGAIETSPAKMLAFRGFGHHHRSSSAILELATNMCRARSRVVTPSDGRKKQAFEWGRDSKAFGDTSRWGRDL